MKTIAFIAVLMLCCTVANAQWKEPADKKFTEDQLKAYLSTAGDWMDELHATMVSIQSATTDAGRVAAVGDLDAKEKAILAKHNMTKPEFDWLAQRALEAYSVATVGDIFSKSADQLKAQEADNVTKLADAQKRLAAYQAAQKDGKRIMTPDDRAAAIKSAKDDQQAAQDDAKQHADDAKAAETEALQHDADAKAASDLAKNPPADITADDKPDYIKGKNDEAQAAIDAAKDARGREADAKKAQTDALAKAAAAGAKADNPDVPVTDDEKASVKSDNDAAITQAQADIDNCNRAKDQLALTEAQIDKSKVEMDKQTPPENVAIMRNHLDEFKNVMARIASNGATTQPGK